jgi:hypothetical protein
MTYLGYKLDARDVNAEYDQLIANTTRRICANDITFSQDVVW